MPRNYKPTLNTSIALLLVVAYTVFSTGVFKATHLCMGRPVSVSFFSAEAKKCPCSLFAHDDVDHCDETHELVKLQDDHQKGEVEFTWHALHTVVIGFTYPVLLQARAGDVQQNDTVSDHIPPLPLYKQHCSFIFYDDDKRFA